MTEIRYGEYQGTLNPAPTRMLTYRELTEGTLGGQARLDIFTSQIAMRRQAADAVMDAAAQAGRTELRASEQRDLDEHRRCMSWLEGQISRVEGERRLFERVWGPVGENQRLADSHRLELRHSMADWSRTNETRQWGMQGAERASLAKIVKGIVTGDWTGADLEQRVMAEGTPSLGGYAVPTPLAGFVLDLARSKMQVLRAGAITVPMTSSTLKMARLDADPTASWRNESEEIDASDPTLGVVEFTARSLACLVKLSWEVLEDAVNADAMVRNAIAQAIALEVDRVALRGSGTPPEPQGLLNTSGVNVTTLGTTDGALPTYDTFIAAYGRVEANNFRPTATIVAPRTRNELSTLKSGESGEYLLPPSTFTDVPILTSNQVPTNLVLGENSDGSEAYIGQWDQLMIGMRTVMTMRLLDQRYAEFGQVGIVAVTRVDVQVARTTAFEVIDGIAPITRIPTGP